MGRVSQQLCQSNQNVANRQPDVEIGLILKRLQEFQGFYCAGVASFDHGKKIINQPQSETVKLSKQAQDSKRFF